MSATNRILSALTTVIRMNDKVEAMLEIALNRAPAFGTRLLDGDPADAGKPRH
jgi:hypothetical protein